MSIYGKQAAPGVFATKVVVVLFGFPGVCGLHPSSPRCHGRVFSSSHKAATSDSPWQQCHTSAIEPCDLTMALFTGFQDLHTSKRGESWESSHACLPTILYLELITYRSTASAERPG
ncbi:unnamed protein product [Pleuronectes platessa]|uniref:Secreted protein n=1 Tax=Pleuronectes platessa TaxID=8262 RepID=A0A9N7U948_PLEPL|nr:unnamed protein product [Pleuronectes platessa]